MDKDENSPTQADAFKLLKSHFPHADDLEITAELLASPLTIWGGLVEVKKANFSNALDKLDFALQKALNLAPHYAKKTLLAWDRELTEFRSTPKLFGKQNTSNFEQKVFVIHSCREIWKGKVKSDAPNTYRGDTHAFTRFVDDVINLHNQTFSARSAIEAYDIFYFKNVKNSH
jgi:hypothetical protein